MMDIPENSIEPFLDWYPSYRWPGVPNGIMWLPTAQYPRVWSEAATDQQISEWIKANKPK